MAPIFDTGPHPMPLPGLSVVLDEPKIPPATPVRLDRVGVAPWSATPRVAVPGQYRFLKWWQLALVLVGVWIPAAGIGLGLFAWWYSLTDKTPALFAVLVYVVVCISAGLIVAMVADKPVIAAVALALMSAVFASALAAAPLYGHNFCLHVSRCLGGIIPY